VTGSSGHQATPTAYSSSIRPIAPRLRDRMRYSHHSGCPVGLAELRYLRLTYLGFDGAAHTGELVVHKKYAAEVVDVFHRLYDARWPIQRMRLVDDYRCDDERSMTANNTSAYNCLRNAGRDVLSAHACGAARRVNRCRTPASPESACIRRPPRVRLDRLAVGWQLARCQGLPQFAAVSR